MENKVFLNNIIYENSTFKKLKFYFLTVFMSVVVGIFYLVLDKYSGYIQVGSEIVIMLVAVLVLGNFYMNKDKYIKKYGKVSAYNKAFFRFHVTAMPLIYVSVLHPIMIQSSQMLPCLVVFRMFGVYFLLSGIILHRKSIKLFGVDNLFMYYVYYPELGKKTESTIHRILRHPIYSAMSRISLGLGLLSGNFISVLCSISVPIMQVLWLSLFEEKDLIERFPQTYIEYMEITPAIFVKKDRIIDFWKFLLSKGE
ncbi:Phospholipid methyltransferase [Streptococcus equinus]|uniref:methyltransferase family protein n=1 Tax=Streptococcus equinus TaxID=1335 RepID=UPI000871825A|nr:methyltransferase [Streptococcus equinus]SCW48531.1 Phospholipid methyltransferase [Streptococcus equinus]